LHSPLQRATHKSENPEFVGQRSDESVRPAIAFPFGLVSTATFFDTINIAAGFRFKDEIESGIDNAAIAVVPLCVEDALRVSGQFY